MNQQVVLKVFEFAILVFALSLHEAAHAWMASQLGDPTARMLGRLTLNPMKHIDPIGTVLIPLTMLFLFPGFLVGWAKPTPVTTRNFRNLRRDDILTTIAGPVSNLVAAAGATLLLIVLARLSAPGAAMVRELASGIPTPGLNMGNPAVPIAMLLYIAVWLNLILAVFNLIPLPPLDGSHVLRHFLPYKALRFYDSIGMIGLIAFFFLGYPVIMMFVGPMMHLVDAMLLTFAI
ncbi:MAG TPA: site-2 protease family protein [Acidobacteriaceae bacterium]|nr:site-2 protease family protein [Acidobacteriaceae bacterium]